MEKHAPYKKTHPENLALVVPKELVQLAPRQLSPVHRVEAFPVEAPCGASLGVVEQGFLQPFLEELRRLRVHHCLRKLVVAESQAEERSVHQVREPEVAGRVELLAV